MNQLIDYILQRQQEGTDEDQIMMELFDAGWREDVILDAFDELDDAQASRSDANQDLPAHHPALNLNPLPATARDVPSAPKDIKREQTIGLVIMVAALVAMIGVISFIFMRSSSELPPDNFSETITQTTPLIKSREELLADPPPQMNKFQNEHMEILVPDGWYPGYSASYAATFTSEDLDNFEAPTKGAFIQVVYDHDSALSVQEYIDHQIEQTRSLGSKIEIISDDSFKIGGQQARQIEVSGNVVFVGSSLDQRGFILVIKGDKGIYAASAATNLDEWDEFSEILKILIESFRPIDQAQVSEQSDSISSESALVNSMADAQRRTAVAALLAYAESYAGNNNGQYPATITALKSEYAADYAVNDSFTIPGKSKQFELTSSTPESDQLQYLTQAVCDQDGVAYYHSNERFIAAAIRLTGGTLYCRDTN